MKNITSHCISFESVTNLRTQIWIIIDILFLSLLIFLFVNRSEQLILLLGIGIAILYRIKWRSDKVIINENEIEIRNWFTSASIRFDLRNIQHYVFNAEPFVGERLLLVTDNMVVAKIRYKNYSNGKPLLDLLNAKVYGND